MTYLFHPITLRAHYPASPLVPGHDIPAAVCPVYGTFLLAVELTQVLDNQHPESMPRSLGPAAPSCPFFYPTETT